MRIRRDQPARAATDRLGSDVQTLWSAERSSGPAQCAQRARARRYCRTDLPRRRKIRLPRASHGVADQPPLAAALRLEAQRKIRAEGLSSAGAVLCAGIPVRFADTHFLYSTRCA